MKCLCTILYDNIIINENSIKYFLFSYIMHYLTISLYETAEHIISFGGTTRPEESIILSESINKYI